MFRSVGPQTPRQNTTKRKLWTWVLWYAVILHTWQSPAGSRCIISHLWGESTTGFPSQRANNARFPQSQFLDTCNPGSTLAQVMACCLTAPSHYLNQCWPVIQQSGTGIPTKCYDSWGWTSGQTAQAQLHHVHWIINQFSLSRLPGGGPMHRSYGINVIIN